MQGWSSLIVKAGLLGLACLDLASALKPSPGCGKINTLKAGNNSITVAGAGSNGRRWYLLNLPAGYDNKHPYRLIFTLHALGGSADQVVAGTGGYLPWYGFPRLVNDTTGAIYVAPNGLDRGWANTGNRDVTLVSAVVDQVKADLCVDEDLLFSAGFSYGASMSYAIACSLPKVFRAVGAQSGGAMSGCQGGSEPIAFYGQHGVAGDLPIAQARQIRDRFIKNNGCTQQTFPTVSAGSGTHARVDYKGCKEGFPVTWIEYDGGHTPQPMDKGTKMTWAADETWRFFSQFK
ncbi:hypothetical protein RB601_004532 [Gaeumannomyces tritici]